MIRVSLPRKMRFGSSKGVSTVIGTIFLVLIVLVVATNVFFWTITQNALYNQAVKESHQMDVDRFSEMIATSHANYSVPQPNTVQVGITVSNEGPVSAQIITAWVVWVVNGKTKYGFNDTLNINLNPGDTLPLTIRVAIPDVSSTGAFNGWLVTARGNLVPLEREKIVSHAQVAFGIGSVMMDFDRFRYYYATRDSKTGRYTLSPWDQGIIKFNVPSKDIVFGVLLSNYDQYRRTITLDERSLLWLYSPAKGAQEYWGIVNVVDGIYNPAKPYVPITLAYGETKMIFFGPKSATQLGGYSCAVNLLLLGKIGDQDYGQNLPFISVYVLP